MPARASTQRQLFAFALWAMALGRPPSTREVQNFFGVHRASGFRIERNWSAALKHHRESKSPAATGTPQTLFKEP